MDKEQLAEKLVEWTDKALTDHNELKALKTVLVKTNQYELAADLRNYEVGSFPIPDGQSEAVDIGNKINLLFRMASLDVPHHTCYLIYRLISQYNAVGDSISLQDTAKIEADTYLFFNVEPA